MAKHRAKPGNNLAAVDYLDAARDHVVALPGLYSQGHFALAMYVSGLAAECVFRAFRKRKGLPFRSDHALAPLAAEAGFPELVPAGDRVRFDAALAELIVGWQNVHRFRSNAAASIFEGDEVGPRHQGRLRQGTGAPYHE